MEIGFWRTGVWNAMVSAMDNVKELYLKEGNHPDQLFVPRDLLSKLTPGKDEDARTVYFPNLKRIYIDIRNFSNVGRSKQFVDELRKMRQLRREKGAAVVSDSRQMPTPTRPNNAVRVAHLATGSTRILLLFCCAMYVLAITSIP